MSITKVVLGIDIGGTNTTYGLIDKKGTCIITGKLPTYSQMPFDILLDRLLEDFNLKFRNIVSLYELVGIGIGAPSANYYKGTIENPSNFNWGKVNVVEYVRNIFSVPVVISNDANIAALGEKMYGAAKEYDNFIEITLGTGLGAGIIIDGKLLHGNDGFAGEIGHAIIERNGRECNCGRKGCLETYASASGIKRTVFEMLANYNLKSSLKDFSFNSLTAKDINDAALNSDELAIAAFEYTGTKLGLALSNTVTHLNPQSIILFGGLALSRDLLLNPTRKAFNQSLLPIYKDKIDILLSDLIDSENVAILGAAAMIWNELEKVNYSKLKKSEIVLDRISIKKRSL